MSYRHSRFFLPAVLFPVLAQAATPSVIQTDPGKDAKLGVYAVFHVDCSSGVAPEIRISRPPSHGVVILQQVTLTTKRVQGCPQISAPARQFVYRPDTGFSGQDEITFDVIDTATGQSESHPVTISVQAMPTKL